MSEIVWSFEAHPNWFYDVPNMKVLIIGSFPPYKDKRNYDFYYPNKQNRFWKILAKIAGKNLEFFSGVEAVKERQKIMETLEIGVEDMAKKIRRKNKSSLDRDIVIEEFYDIFKIIKDHPKLETLVIAGFSGPHSPYGGFKRFYEEKTNIYSEVPKKVKAGDEFFISCPRKMRCLVVNSTSPLVFKVSFDSMVEQFSKYIKVKK